ncbi:MAG: fibronectin type III domain-containing protein [Flavobacteriaceae bacterium]|nr:fibronectin type III domain-containing protein [Flavobacteriaceae bacterium]
MRSVFNTLMFVALCAFPELYAQIGINVPTNESPQAQLDIRQGEDNLPGLLIPRVSSLPVAAPGETIAEGLMVFVQGENPNFYVYVDGVWQTIGESAGVDTTPPSVPLNLTASNPTSTMIDLAWTASTDNVGVEGYKIYDNSDDSLVATVTGSTSLSTTISGLTSNTSYTFYATAYDAAGNESDPSDTATETTTSTSSVTINLATFENGWDGWRDGGNRVSRQTNGNCTGFNGSPSRGYIRLSDDTGNGSSMFLDDKNLSSYIYVTIEFIYKTNNKYDSNDYFTFEYRDGDGNWTEVFRHTGQDTNCTTETITILALDYNFGTADDFKFESYANRSDEQARIHDVVITGYY